MAPLSDQIIIFVILWAVTASAIIVKGWKNKKLSGLTIIYVISLSLIHWFVGLIYLLPWHQYINGSWMLNGFRESTYGMCAFGIGNLILAPFLVSLFSLPRLGRIDAKVIKQAKQKSLHNLPKRYFLIGLIFYFILPYIASGLPTMDALIGAGQQLMVVGVCLICWQAWHEKNNKRFKRWLLFSLLLPFISIVSQGYLASGLSMVLIVLFFVAEFFKPKWKALIIGVVLVYFGLSFYLMYMRDRPTLRGLVWGEAPITVRINALRETLSNPEWFSPFNLQHLEIIDTRMNQNILVGAAVEHINAERVDYASGRTIWDSLLALIPRTIWTEKNIYAGSPDIVSKYTGLVFAEETSVGIGQVMEFYINFGRKGVIAGFLFLGVVIAIIDIMAGYYLAEDKIEKFILWFLPGLALLNVGGSFVEITASAGASVFIAYLLTSKYRNLLFALLVFYLLIEGIKRFILHL